MEQDLQKEYFEKFSVDLPQDVKKVLWALLQGAQINQELIPVEGKLRFEVNLGASCIRYLTLYDVSGVPAEADVFEFHSLSKQEAEYALAGEAWCEETESAEIFVMRFSGASVELHPIRGDALEFEGSPWRQLSNAAIRICEKYDMSAQLLNEGEKELLPLLVDLAKLFRGDEMPAPQDNSDLPALKAYIREQGYEELLRPIERVEGNLNDFRRVSQLYAKLDRVKYEPLFRSIWNRVKATQQEYPTEAEVKKPHGELTELRQRVTNKMHEMEYGGAYPDFYKTGEFKGFRLAERQGVERFVLGRKHGLYHIHIEELPGKAMQLQIFCGTQLSRNKQDPGDILSCMFDTNGHTFTKIMFCFTQTPEEMERVLVITDKQARLIKLTREEREQILDQKGSSVAVFLLSLILGGGAFAFLFVPAMFCLEVLFCLLGGEQMIWSLADWLQIFFMSWLGFGGLVGALVAFFNHMK